MLSPQGAWVTEATRRGVGPVLKVGVGWGGAGDQFIYTYMYVISVYVCI